MAESRRLALEQWREEKRRQKQQSAQVAAKTTHRVGRVLSHRTTQGAPACTQVIHKERETAKPLKVVAARRVSREPAPLEPIDELEKDPKLLYKTPAKPSSLTGAETDRAVDDRSLDSDDEPASKRRRRRKSYISPSSNVPSLAGGAQRILTPTRLAQQESDDGGMDGDTDGATPDMVPGPRRVSVLAQRRKSDESTGSRQATTPYKDAGVKEEYASSRETISLGSIGVALRVPQTTKEAELKDEQRQKSLSILALRVKEEVKSTDNANDAKTKVESPRPDRKLIFPERVPAQQSTRASIELPTSRKSISGRNSLDNLKPAQSLSERLAGNPKFTMSDFIVTKNLGQGKFGNVYLAREKCSNVTVALKVLFKSPLTRDGGTSNLKREVEIQFRLRHPNVLRMFGYFYDEACVYLVLEYAPYGELFKELAKEKFFSDAVAAHYVTQVVEALKHCHGCGVIHRDIKPENLLLGYNKTVKLADFGWSVYAPKPYSHRKTFCGTPDYLSPEMVMGESYDYRTDSWSLGVLTYELLVGITPFKCEHQMEMYRRIGLADYHFPPTPLVSESAKNFIAGLLQRKPRDRMSLEDAANHPWLQNRNSK
ncbi:hypothetical protein V7S43_006878 [Phytophthora oleae]|uniref:Aurora kinase n=1 Tax=Phytophthora oleae TaxID=2107226 RepID=A0ABD3FQP2_9STRA